ncbi:MAG: DUF6056 family protein [Oscillospiraceae bacterium]|nr:DUF6056 family protein [Oscillospiraceae bacterium]
MERKNSKLRAYGAGARLTPLAMPLVFSLAAVVLTLCVSRSVTLYGDDYYYLSIPFTSARDFFAAHARNYLNDNGRFVVHVLASLFLRADICVWRVFLAFELGVIVFLVCRVADAGIAKGAAAVAGALLFGVDVGRESVFWLTGSFNYVYPAMLSLLYWHLLRRGKALGGARFLIPVAGLFSAASVEQAAVITVVLTLAELLPRGGRGALSAKLGAVTIAAVTVGAASVLLAPGNFARLGVSGRGGGSLVALIRDNARYLFVSGLFSPGVRLYAVVLAIALSAFFFKRARSRVVSALFGVAAAIAAAAAVFCPGGAVTPELLTVTAFFASASLAAVILSKDKTAAAALFAAGASLIVMLPLPTLGLRNILFSLFYSAVFLARVMPELPRRAGVAAAVIALAASAAIMLSAAVGYASSAAIDAVNRSILAKWSKAEPDGRRELVLFRMRDDKYGWSMPYNSNFHSYYYRLYFGIPAETEIIWRAPDAAD